VVSTGAHMKSSECRIKDGQVAPADSAGNTVAVPGWIGSSPDEEQPTALGAGPSRDRCGDL
jgi:hypothetical protein